MISLLICEDERIERESLRHLLSLYFGDEIMVCGEAADGLGAVELARNYKPDIIIMDIQMPPINGLSASEVILKDLPETEIIISTAYSRFEYAKKAIELGVFNYLVKPGTPEEFKGVMNRLLVKIRKKRSLKVLEAPVEGRYGQLIHTIKDYVEVHVADNITVKDISEIVHRSENYTGKLFKQETGMGLKDYITKIKMEKARELIQTKIYIIKEVALQVGYADQNYFSKAYKKYYGYPPTDIQ